MVLMRNHTFANMLTNSPASTSSTLACPICDLPLDNSSTEVKDHSVSGEFFSITRCNSCGLQITLPQPPVEEIGRFYASEEYISHSDSRKGLINSAYHKVRNYMLGQKATWVKQFLGTSSGQLLDMGAGTGYFAAKMKSIGWSVVAIEPDAKAREVARREHNLELLSPESAKNLPAGEFDVITLWHVLEHIHDLREQVALYHKLLKPNGSLIIAVPNYTSHDANHYKEYWAAYDVPRHLWHFSPASMRKLLSVSGFDVKEIKPMPFDAFYVSLLSEKYKSNGKAGLISGGFQGMLTYFKSLLNREQSSSLIYFSKKK